MPPTGGTATTPTCAAGSGAISVGIVYVNVIGQEAFLCSLRRFSRGCDS